LPRDLSDVLHYFIPEADAAPESRRRAAWDGEDLRPDHPAALAVVGVPLAAGDVVRAALLWNVVVEVARMGGRAVLISPEQVAGTAPWPAPGVGPLGAEVVASGAGELGALHRDALDLAVDQAANAAGEGGLIFVHVPPLWLREASAAAGLLRWTLLFSSTERNDLIETYGIAKLLVSVNPKASVGVTIHGTRARGEAEAAFARLQHAARRHLQRELSSYGLLVDDLHVYRAIVAQRPVGLAHPQSPAAHALRDVAQLLLDDSRKLAVV
jgi:hypothetical protein